MVLNLSHKIPVRDARPAPAPGKMAALALKIFKTAPPRPKFDFYPTLPQRFYSLPRPAHPKICFFCPAPQKKGCPCIPDADDLGDDDHDDHDDHDDGDCKYFWRWSPKSYRNIYLGLEQFPRWEGKGGGLALKVICLRHSLSQARIVFKSLSQSESSLEECNCWSRKTGYFESVANVNWKYPFP